MSDSWIILIPEDPFLVPPPERHPVATSTFRELAPEAWEINAVVTDQVRFIDAGENFENINCPKCNSALSTEWWQEQMSDDFADGGFVLKRRTVPCCSAQVTLHELRYQWSQGFARFSLEAMNPNISELPEVGLRTIESLLECPLRVVYCHI